MFAVYGKSLLKEKTRKRRSHNYEISDETAMREFNKDTGAYKISPHYSSKERCREFINLAELYPVVRCLYIANLEPLKDKNGNIIINIKTGKPKVKYVRCKDCAT